MALIVAASRSVADGLERCRASASLWGSWKGWAERRNESVGSQKSLGQALDEIGYHFSKSQNVRGHDGIKLKAQDPQRTDLDG